VRRVVFGPRRPLVTAPPPDSVTPQGAPGRVLVFRPTEAFEPLALAGRAVVSPVGGFVAVPQPPGPARVFRQPEHPPPDLLPGRVTQAPWGLVQPVRRPTAPVVAAAEEPHPEPGRVAKSGARPPFGPTPTGRTVVTVAAREEPPPERGRVTRPAGAGFAVPPRPVRALVAAPEVRTPAPGRATVAKSPPPDLSPQQPAGVTRVAAAEEPVPFAGRCYVRQWPRVPSDRYVLRPHFARAEEPPPEPGRAVSLRVVFHTSPPGRPLLVRPADPPPAGGAVALLRAWVQVAPPPRPTVSLVALAGPHAPPEGRALTLRGLPLLHLDAQQLPGRVLVAWAEAPPPDWIARGRALVLTGWAAGAIPPTVATRPGGRFRRADTSRLFKRVPRMSAASLAYLTRTKTPTEVVLFVFDFTNFPEVVAGATISSAVVSGPGGQALSGLVAGTPAVLSAAAVIDGDGNTVAAGKGVQCTLAGGSAGSDVLVECAVTLSTGSVAVVQGKVAVRNAV